MQDKNREISPLESNGGVVSTAVVLVTAGVVVVSAAVVVVSAAVVV